ncbi:MAG TPA: ABC transporter permease [Chitinophagaceae bacterium]|nr:ABC transporter permease [Chitinophagaceae bacterium]
MIESYFKTAWRNLLRNKGYSAINIVGLAIGMAVVILISLWIGDEVSFDKYHANYKRIARVMQNQVSNGNIATLKAMPIPAAVELRNTYGNDFDNIILSSWNNPHILTVEDKSISRPGSYMEPEAPEMLTLKMVAGSRSGLKDPSSILLAESVAKTLFGNSNPITQVVKLDGVSLKVVGVYQDLPENTSFKDLLFISPWEAYVNSEEIKNAEDDWNSNSFQVFVQIAENKDMQLLSAKIKNIKSDKIRAEQAGLRSDFFLYPMSRWHLYTDFKNGLNAGGSIQYVWLFGIIGFFALLLACINFMNLSTARSEKRAAEVGIRKAIGSSKKQLVIQFFSESLLTAVLAFIFSLLIVELALPFFNELSGKKMSILWTGPLFWTGAVGFCIITGLIAGIYPSLYLSSFQPVKVLKGTFRAGSHAGLPRKMLVVVQFTVSLILIIGTIIVFQQIQFAKNRSVGYNQEGVIMIRDYTGDFHRHFNAMRNDLLQTGLIEEVAESGNQITMGSRTSGGFNWRGKDVNSNDEFATFAVSPAYGKTIGWQFVNGRDFNSQSISDSSGLILNETAEKKMGIKNPVGQIITWGDRNYTILGVVKDIVIGSPYEPVMPTFFYIEPEAGLLNIKINAAANTGNALNKIETICKKFAPTTPFEFTFVDDAYAKKFGEEERIGKLASIFSVLAIFISCLGLFGLASFVAEQRIKEIGVRKVLGASIFSLWRLLSNEFLLLVLISLLIAGPTAYFFMNRWLQNYQYHTEFSWWSFAAAGSAALIITLLTVSFQAIKAAIANPIKSLRTE